MIRTATRLSAVATALTLSLAAAGCGRDDSGGGGDGAAPGVTDEPCPNAVDEEKGCIYLGVISDFTGVFSGVGKPFSDGQAAFWQKVNEEGGIGDYEVDVTKYVKDSTYDAKKHATVFGEIKDDIAALAQSLGTPQTEAILADAEREDILVAPASLASVWPFEDIALEVGTNYCAEGMNVVDYAVDQGAKHIAAIHYPGDYGDDAMVGARIAAEARGVEFTDITTGPVDAGDTQEAAIGDLIKSKADFVLLSTGPKEMATIVGGALQGGFRGRFVGSIPTWNAAVLATPAAPAITAAYMQATSFPTWESDAPGTVAMREALGDEVVPNDWFQIGWSSGYVMKAVLEQAVEDDDLSRANLVAAATSLEGVDSEGMLPEGSGNYAGEPNDAAVRVTQLNRVDPKAASKVSVAVEPFTGPTAEGYDFTEPCYLQK